MKIFYDYQALSGQNYGGVSRIYTELNKLLLDDFEIINGVYFSDNHYVLESLENIKQMTPLIKTNYRGKIQNIINRAYSIKQIISKEIDIIHPTYYNQYLIPYIKKESRIVVTLLDMIHENELKNKNIKGKNIDQDKLELCKKANKVAAISNSTKMEFLKIHIDFDPDKIEVIHLGNSLNPNIYNFDGYKIDILPEKYILFVGKRWFYKNFKKLILNIKELLADLPDIKFVCAGGGQFTSEEKQFIAELKLENSIIHISFDNDKKLVYLYQNALFFTYPSQNEGFGIPILESFSCGCPTLLNNMTSLPEVGGDAAYYFNIDDKETVTNAFEKLITDEKIRQKLIKDGLEREKLFSWQKCAQEYSKLYKSLK